MVSEAGTHSKSDSLTS